MTEDSDKYTGGIWPSIRHSLTIAKHCVRRLIEKIDPENNFLDKKFFHLNIEVKLEKFKGSVGLELAVSLLSLAFNTGIPEDFAFTGQINLNGEVLLVGGLHKKIEGAIRARMRTIFLPSSNKKQVESLSQVSKENINISMDRMLKIYSAETQS